jgi:cyclopropane fatty-acyl-phospholipid synthase-like methyltransferase
VSDAVAPDLRPARRVRAYCDAHIHELAITRHEVGSAGFFADVDEYHFEKLYHLRRLMEFHEPEGRRVLDVGCGSGVDLLHFARGGAAAIGIDVSEAAIRLAAANLGLQHVAAHLVTERFPVKSRLHGWKGALFNGLFVGTFNALPRRWVSRFGWHLIAICAR